MYHPSPYQAARKLNEQGVSVDVIAETLGVHRATVFRWLKGIRLKGIMGFEAHMRSARKRRRRRRIHPLAPALIRETYDRHRCCGEKLVHRLQAEHGITVSKATVYRILGETYRLRSPWKHQQRRGPVPRATKARMVIQVDTVDLGNLFVLTAVDTFTREAVAVPLRSLKAREVARHVRTLRKFFGPVETLQTDNGKEFRGAFEQTVRTWCGRHRRIHPSRWQENAFVESFHRTLRRHAVGWHAWDSGEFGDLADTLQQFTSRYNGYPHLSLNLASPAEFAKSHLT